MTPLLSRAPLPDTHWPYFTKRLERWWFIDWEPWQVPALWIDNQATYRLTPESFKWFWLAGYKTTGDQTKIDFVAGVLLEMDAWMTTHFPVDVVRNAKPALPKIESLFLDEIPKQTNMRLKKSA